MNPQVKNTLLEMLPIYGTYKSAERFINNPTWAGAGETALSLLGDVASLAGVGLIAKGASTAGKAAKAYKVADKASDALAATQKANDVTPLIKQYKHNNNVVKSASLMNEPKAQALIPRRIKANQALKQEIIQKQNVIDNAYNHAVDATRNASSLVKKSRQYYNTAKPLPVAAVGAEASTRAVNTRTFDNE